MSATMTPPITATAQPIVRTINASQANEGRDYWYIGHRFTVLATGDETGGRFGLVETLSRSGQEPPAHRHSQEDEFFFILEGEGTFTTGETTYRAQRGDFIWMPKGKVHAFQLTSEIGRALVGFFPSPFEGFFRHFMRPAAGPGMPPAVEEPYSIAEMLRVGAEYGIMFVPPGAVTHAANAITPPPGESLNLLGEQWTVLLGHPEITVLDWVSPVNSILPRHRHFEAVEGIYVLEGAIVVNVDGEPPRILRPGDFALLPAGISHTHNATGGAPSRAIQFLAPGGVEKGLAEGMAIQHTAPERLPEIAHRCGIEMLL
jgi:quercetin dioxygenase-like cupin family protein